MKKRFAGAAAVLAAVILFTGCGSNAGDQPLSRMNVEKYVTLGDYNNMQIVTDVNPPAVSDEEVEMLMKEAYLGAVTAEHGGIVDRAVEEGDTVVIDYEGKLDGVAFAGGTARGDELTIGSNSFIDGFEDGLVGVMPGETVDLELTFPEVYKNNTELAGQDVVFTVTVRFIRPVDVNVADMEDVVVAALGLSGVSTVEEFRQSAYDYLYSSAEIAYLNSLEKNISQAVIDGCEFKNLPKALMEKYRETIKTNIESWVTMYDMTLDDYASLFGKTGEEMLDAYTEDYVRQNLAMQAIANAEGLNVTDEELQEELAEYAASEGYASVEALVGENSLEDYRDYFMNEKVMDFLMEKYGELTD